LKGLSDGVFAIVLTLLVLNLIPDGARTGAQLLAAWPAYLAYLAGFLTIGSIWLNHNAAFSRIQRADPAVLVLNLVLLLGAALVPWPTVLIANAIRAGNRGDEFAAMIVFAAVALLLSLPWSALDRHVARRPHLLAEADDVAWMRRHARWSDASIILSLATVGIAFLSPIASLIVYLPAVLGFVVSRLVERD
jgi:uncharacterized membrane protein